MLRATLLKTPGVELDGKLVAFPYRRAEALLYYMLVQRSATRQELIALLWESFDEATGMKNLRNTLYTLKKVLGGDFLISPQKSLVIINPEWEYSCDYDRFTLQEDFSAYGGPFLQGFAVKHAFAYEEWLSRTREKLRTRYLQRMSRCAKTALEQNDIENATHWAEEYLREEPLDEEMCAFLMERWRTARQYAKAAQVYQALKDRLCEDVGADPLESTTLLYYEIMNEWNDTAQPATPVQDPALPFIPAGREPVYATLRAAADSFRLGAVRRCSQLLVGEVGSGKSELLDQFLRTGDLSSFLVIRCACLQTEKQMPLAPWDRITLPLAQFITEENLSVPAPVLARLGQAFSAFRGQSEAAASARILRQLDQPLIDSLLLMMTAVTRRRQVMLILEDLQWIDSDSLRLAEVMLRRLETGRLMTILTCRSDSGPVLEDTLVRALADGLLQEHRLLPLSREQTRALLCAELGEEVADRLEGQFYRETGGNLRLLMELSGAYRRNGNIEQTLNTLDDILMERLDGLDDSAVHIAELISVFPQDAPCDILLRLMDGDDRRLGTGLEELLRRGLIEEYRTRRTVTYRFSHQRIRELVYDRLTYFQRIPLHLCIAPLLVENDQARHSDSCRRAALHFELGGDAHKALEYSIRALDLESVRSCDPFPLLPEEDIPFVAFDHLASQTAAAGEKLAILEREMGGAALRPLTAQLTLIKGRLALFSGNFEEGAALLGTLSAAGSEKRDHDTMAKACYLLAAGALFVQSVDQAERYTAAGMRLLQRGSDPVLVARFQRLRGDCFCLRGAYDKSSYYFLEALEELEKHVESPTGQVQLAAAHTDFARLNRQRMDYAGACSHFKKALGLLDGGLWPGAVWVCVHYGRAAFAMDDHLRARELFAKGYEISQKTGELWGRSACAAYTAYYQVEDDDYELAAKSLADAQDADRRLKSPLEGAILCLTSLRILQRMERRGDHSKALENLLSTSADSYARQGLRLVSGIPDIFEAEQLSRSLREGITGQQHVRASELYSKNKHFMTE